MITYFHNKYIFQDLLSIKQTIGKMHYMICLKIINLPFVDRLGGRIFFKSLKTVNGIERVDVGGQWLGK